MHGQLALMVSAAFDPKRTSAGLKCRSAAVSGLGAMCYPLEAQAAAEPISIQNDSGLSQGLASRSVPR
jgi:urocanate hydratase